MSIDYDQVAKLAQKYGDSSMLPARIRFAKPNTEPASATIEFWDEWSRDEVVDGIADAVEYMRRQSKV